MLRLQGKTEAVRPIKGSCKESRGKVMAAKATDHHGGGEKWVELKI